MVPERIARSSSSASLLIFRPRCAVVEAAVGRGGSSSPLLDVNSTRSKTAKFSASPAERPIHLSVASWRSFVTLLTAVNSTTDSWAMLLILT